MLIFRNDVYAMKYFHRVGIDTEAWVGFGVEICKGEWNGGVYPSFHHR